MTTDPLSHVRMQVGTRVAEIRAGGTRIKPADLFSRMDAIRQLAAEHGLATLERLARHSAQRALLPGPRIAIESCLEHIAEALDSRSERDCDAILAAVAIRLH